MNWFYYYLRPKLLNKANNSCETCHSLKNLQIHHLDSNRKNNNLDNLIVLCSKCHYRIEFEKRGHPNKGKYKLSWGFLKKSGKYGKEFNKCLNCGTTKKKHHAKGLCRKCYEKNRKEYKKQWWINRA